MQNPRIATWITFGAGAVAGACLATGGGLTEPSSAAIAYHFFKDFDTTGEVFDRIQSTYDGPLSLAEDYMVWNVTKDEIRERMAAVDEDVWPPPASEAPVPPDASQRIPFTEYIVSGKLDVLDAIQPIYDEINAQYGLQEKPSGEVR